MLIVKLRKILITLTFSSFLFAEKSFAGNGFEIDPTVSSGQDWITEAGDIIQIANPIFAGSVTLAKGDYEGFKQFVISTAINSAGVQGLKYALNEVEIDGTRLGLRPNGKDHNMPSGHTAAAFNGAWFLQKRYGWEYSIIPLAGAAFTGYSRYDSNNHTLAAIGAGAVFGILVAEFTTSRKNDNFNISLGTVDGRGAKLNLAYRF